MTDELEFGSNVFLFEGPLGDVTNSNLRIVIQTVSVLQKFLTDPSETLSVHGFVGLNYS